MTFLVVITDFLIFTDFALHFPGFFLEKGNRILFTNFPGKSGMQNMLELKVCSLKNISFYLPPLPPPPPPRSS